MKKLKLKGIAKDLLSTAEGTIWWPLVQDVRKNCDYDIISFEEVINTADDVSDVIPYLVDRMCAEDDAHIVDGIAHSLMRKYCFHLISINKLIEKYKGFEDTWMGNNANGGRGALANLISMMLDKDDLDKIYATFLNDKSLGSTRIWFLNTLNKYKANQKFYDYLVKTKKDLDENISDSSGNSMGGKAAVILNSKKWKKFAEENALEKMSNQRLLEEAAKLSK